MNEEIAKYHVPVLLKPSVDGMNIHPGGTYVDVTFGGGGHSREITLNHTALGSSASVSLEPRVALPVSTVKVILLVASLAGSKATWASNFLK